jgi:hypothetical protein
MSILHDSYIVHGIVHLSFAIFKIYYYKIKKFSLAHISSLSLLFPRKMKTSRIDILLTIGKWKIVTCYWLIMHFVPYISYFHVFNNLVLSYW